MKKVLALFAALFAAYVALDGQQVSSLFQRIRAVPGAQKGDVYYTDDTTGVIKPLHPPATPGVLYNNAGVLSWVTPGAGGGASPLTTKGDLYTFSTIDARLAVSGPDFGAILVPDSSTATGLRWVTFTPSPTSTPTSTPTNTPTVTPTSTPTSTPTNTPTVTPTITPTPTPTNTPTVTPTNTPTPTPTNTHTPIALPLSTANGGTGANNTATANSYLKGDGSVFNTSTGAASGTGACSVGSVVTGLNSDAAPTCATIAGGAIAPAWSYTRNSLTSGTVVQNTDSRAQLHIILCGTTTATPVCEWITDASNPPTASTAKCSNSNGLTCTFAAWVLPNHYYKFVGASVAFMGDARYTLTRGTTTGSDVTASRAYTTVYQNTSGSTIWVQIKLGSGGRSSFLTDTANPPTTQVWSHTVNSGSDQTVMVPVLNNHYYKLTNTGSGSVVLWNEYTWDTVTVTRSRLFANAGGGRPPLTTDGAAAATCYINTGGRAIFGIWSGSNTSTNTTLFAIEGANTNGTSSTETFTQTMKPNNTYANTFSGDAATSGNVRCVYYGIVPMDIFQLYNDASITETRQNWYEWSIQ